MDTTISKRKNTVEDSFYIIGWCLIALSGTYYLISVTTGFHISRYLMPCILHSLTGLYCPGCGGTRAVMLLLHGHPVMSFIYHPFVPYTALLGGWFMISQTIERLSRHRIRIGLHYRDWYLWTAIALIGLNFIIKNTLLLGFGIRLL